MAVQEKTTQIREVAVRQTGKGDIFEVIDSEGTKYATFNRGAADHARQLVGQTVRLKYVEKQNNRNGVWYTNLYYEGAESTYTPTSPPPNGNVGQAQAGAWGSPPPEGDREVKIVRQSSLKAAVHTLAYLPENERTPRAALEIAEFYLHYIFDGFAPEPVTPTYADTAAYAPEPGVPF